MFCCNDATLSINHFVLPEIFSRCLDLNLGYPNASSML